MTPHQKTGKPLWRRPQPSATGPNRSFGGFYRASDRTIRGKDLRGVPLQTAEDAAVAVVRMGYRVVDAQIERGLDMARRLRGAADRAGVGDSKDMLNLTEDLLTRGALLGLELLESVSNRPESPLRRLVTSQLRMLGSLLGLSIDDATSRDRGRGAPETGPARSASEQPAPPASAAGYSRVRIRHGEGSTKRAITIARWDMDAPSPQMSGGHELKFHLISGTIEQSLDGTLTLATKGPAVLEIVTTDAQPSGRWRAAVCSTDGDQLGILEIDL